MTNRAADAVGGAAARWPRSRAVEDLIRPPQVPRGALLVLAPHPDDEVLASGGLIGVHVDRGDRVRVLFLTDGRRGGFRADLDEAYVRRREREAEAGLACLGVRDFGFLRHPDQRLRSADGLAGEIAREVEAFRPDAVVVPSPFEVHPDHLAAGRALAAALERTGADPRILLVEIGGPLVANWILDVTGELMERKRRALRCHESQLADADFEEKMLALNRYRTVNCGEREVVHAEGYLELRARDLGPLLTGLETLLSVVERTRPSLTWSGPPPGNEGRP